MKNIRIYTFIFVFFILSGCVAKGPKFTQPDFNNIESAQIFIYRPFIWLASATAPDIYINGEKIIRLWPKGYTFINAGSGNEVKITSEKNITRFVKNDEIIINVKSGQKYFVKYLPHHRELLAIDYLVNSNNFELIEEKIAIEEIKKCSFIKPIKSNF